MGTEEAMYKEIENYVGEHKWLVFEKQHYYLCICLSKNHSEIKDQNMHINLKGLSGVSKDLKCYLTK